MLNQLQPIFKFIKSQINAGIVLIAVTVLAMLIANSPLSQYYFDLFEKTYISIDFYLWQLSKPLYYWINDGLMAIFFFLIGLEVKREILIGELSSPQKAMFPMVGAIGGIAFPAAIFISINWGNSVYLNGWAIPTATDIAFALGIITLLKTKAPIELKIFLTTLAVIDDIAAVLAIAIFYTSDIAFTYLIISFAGLGLLFILNKLGVRYLWIYLIIGLLAVWYPMLKSGVHATIAGVLLAFTIPFKRNVNTETFIEKVRGALDNFRQSSNKESQLKLNANQYSALTEIMEAADNVSSPLQNLEHNLHNFTLYFIMPLFAFANTGIMFEDFDLGTLVTSNLSFGIFFGLFVGKVLGISLFVWIAKKFKIIVIPKTINFQQIIGAGFLAGIGFTMSIFITDLAFHGDELIIVSKISILFASLLSGFTGYFLIKKAYKPQVQTNE